MFFPVLRARGSTRHRANHDPVETVRPHEARAFRGTRYAPLWYRVRLRRKRRGSPRRLIRTGCVRRRGLGGPALLLWRRSGLIA
jgi:hypothetical protein